MKSHIDEARSHLLHQITSLNTEIRQLTRQRDKLTKALELLAPVDRKRVTKQQPTRQEVERRTDVVEKFLDEWKHSDTARLPFSAHDILYAMSEDEGLLGPYQSMMRSDRIQKKFNFRIEENGKGRRPTTFVLELDNGVKGL